MDFNFGQLETRERPAVAFPCLLVRFGSWPANDMGELAQTITGDVTITIGFNPYSSTSSITPSAYRMAGLEYFEIEQRVHRALHGWAPVPDLTGSMTRAGAAQDSRRPGLIVRNIPYRLAADDYSTQRGTTTTPASFELTAELAQLIQEMVFAQGDGINE